MAVDKIVAQNKENEIIMVQKRKKAKREIIKMSKLRTFVNDSPEKGMEELQSPIAQPYSTRRIKNFSYDDRFL